MNRFTVLFLAGSSALALSAQATEGIQAEVFSAGTVVTCKTPDLTIKFIPRAPKLGERVTVREQSGQSFVLAKVDATVNDSKSGQLLETLTLNDETDPWEASWPVYQGEKLSLYSQDAGRPTSLNYKGANLASKASCSFE